MKQWYFDYNGKRYYSGQVILIEGDYDPILKKAVSKEAVFVFCETKSNRHVYKELRKGCGTKWCTDSSFKEIIVGIVEGKTAPEYVQQEYNEWCQRNKKLTIFEELEQVEGMLGAWTMYILAMLASLVCKAWLAGWVLSSLVFFTYRYNKLEERKDK